jgi:hypothetical protein
MAFHPGDWVELVAIDDPSTRLPPGDRGTVTGVREVPEPTIDVHWDNDSTLSVLPEASPGRWTLQGSSCPSQGKPAWQWPDKHRELPSILPASSVGRMHQ